MKTYLSNHDDQGNTGNNEKQTKSPSETETIKERDIVLFM